MSSSHKDHNLGLLREQSLLESQSLDASPERRTTVEDQSPLFDNLLTKIGFGKYQYIALIFISLTNLNEGAENIVLSFLVAILDREWGVTVEENGLLGSLIWLGFLIGSLLSGPIADRFGRKRPLNFVTLLLYVFAVLCSFANNFRYLLVIRSIYGFLGGFQTPLCLTYLAEIIPKEVRGKALILAGASFTVGQLFACFVGFFTLESTSKGDWKSLFLWVAQPTLISWIGINFFLDESPRYEMIVKKNIQGGIDILNKIAETNNQNLEITEQDKIELREWANKSDVLNQETAAGNFLTLFNKDNREITLYLWPMWFVLCLVSYGVIYILPLTISALEQSQGESGDTSGLWGVVFPILGEVPAITIAYFIIERNLFGRRKTMIIGFIISTIACFLAYCFFGFIFWVTIARGVFEAVFLVIFPYTLELYPTLVRVTGLGMSSSFGRIGGVAMPWVSLFLFQISPKLPYLGFAVLAGVGIWCSFKLKYDTTNKELDFEMKRIHS